MSLSLTRVDRLAHRPLFSRIAKLRIGGSLRFDTGEWQGKGHPSQALACKRVQGVKVFAGKYFSAKKTYDGTKWVVTRVK